MPMEELARCRGVIAALVVTFNVKDYADFAEHEGLELVT